MPLHLFLVFVAQWAHFILGTDPPKKDFHPPVSIPIVLAANFGELRTNHFHMGIDIKTNGQEGYKLYSIDEGYISRVNVSPYGYGKCVYINHPGGITSVYAHCQQFTGKLAEKIRAIQLENKSSEIEIYFEPNELRIQKGENFALSGNSGSSRGPHLHFEIRDTYTEAALNPLSFGFKVKDEVIPTIQQLKVYSLNKDGYQLGGTKEYKIKQDGGTACLSTPVYIDPSFFTEDGGVGFAINGMDQFSDSYHSCGLYGFSLKIDGKEFVQYQLDRIPFEYSRFLNIYTDYWAFGNGKKYHKAFASVSNPLPFYKGIERGIFHPEQGKTYQVDYEVYDINGNKTALKFELIVSTGEHKVNKWISSETIHPDSSYSFSFEKAGIEIPMNCTYEPMNKRLSANGSSISFTSDNYPVQNAFTVFLRPRADAPIAKQYIMVNGRTALSTRFIDGWLQADCKLFGEIQVAVDLTPPTISSINVRPVIQRKKTTNLLWRMNDRESGLKDYGVWVDGKWEVLEYESKGDYAFLPLHFLSDGSHVIKVQAIDNQYNLTEKEFLIEIK